MRPILAIDISGLGQFFEGIGTLMVGVIAIITLRTSRSTKRDLADNTALTMAAHEAAMAAVGELETLNGKTVGKLADETEGRRIDLAIPAEDQTASERHYVASVKKSDAAERKLTEPIERSPL